MSRMLPFRQFSLLQLLLLLAGALAAIGLAWTLIFNADVTDQLIALLAIIFTLTLIFYGLRNTFLLWLFCIPFAPFLSFDLRMPEGVPDLSYTRVVGSFLALYLFMQIARGQRRFFALTPFDLSIPFFLLPLLWAAFRAYYGWLWGVQTIFDAFLMPLLVYFIARQLIRTPQDFRALAKTLLAITVIIAIAAVVEQTTGFAPFRDTSTARIYSGDIRKVGSFLGNPAYVGLALAVVIPLALLLIAESPGLKARLGPIAALLVLEAGIIATFNRSSLAGGVIAPLVFALLNRKLLKFIAPAILAAGLLLGLGWGALQGSAAATRLGSSQPIAYRLTSIRYGLEIHRTSPWIGVGWGRFGRLAADKGFRENGINVLPSTHNSYLNFLVSGGYLLLGGYLVMAAGLGIALLAAGRRARRRQSHYLFPAIQVAWASYFAYFIPIVAFDNVFSIYANIIFFAIMGAALSLSTATPPELTFGGRIE